MRTEGKLLWSATSKIDDKYQQWYAEISISKEEKKKLTDLGLKVKTTVDDDDNITYSFKATRKLAKRKGKKVVGTNPAPVIVDKALQPFSGIIGQGSDVVLIHKPYAWEYKGTNGWSSDFQKLQILNLVEYVPENSEESFPDEEEDDLKVEGEGLEESKESEEDNPF